MQGRISSEGIDLLAELRAARGAGDQPAAAHSRGGAGDARRHRAAPDLHRPAYRQGQGAGGRHRLGGPHPLELDPEPGAGRRRKRRQALHRPRGGQFRLARVAARPPDQRTRPAPARRGGRDLRGAADRVRPAPQPRAGDRAQRVQGIDRQHASTWSTRCSPRSTARSRRTRYSRASASSCGRTRPSRSPARSTGLKEAGWQGALLAVVVLYFFLRRWGPTLVTSLSIPFSVIAACGVPLLPGQVAQHVVDDGPDAGHRHAGGQRDRGARGDRPPAPGRKGRRPKPRFSAPARWRRR